MPKRKYTIIRPGGAEDIVERDVENERREKRELDEAKLTEAANRIRAAILELSISFTQGGLSPHQIGRREGLRDALELVVGVRE